MDRRSKIIVSVIGIFIVLLALVGITYGYFLTQVQGNTNDTSISITTANLRLVYNDGQNIEAENIQPGETVYTKTFTVTNEGNASIDYEVYLENVINNFVHEEDLLMFITCSSNIEGNTCNGYGEGSVDGTNVTFGESIYPLVNSKLISTRIDPKTGTTPAEVHTYTLYLRFNDDDSDQSIDMGKTLQGKIQIYDPKDVVAITGTVSGYDSSYYVEMHSEVKTSEIASDGSYIFYGVVAEEHTIYVKKRNSDGTTSNIGDSNINITKGNEESISSNASSIVIDDNTDKATINIGVSNTKDSITLSGVGLTSYNPYKSGTLAHKIINNALYPKVVTSTVYSEIPLTTPGEEVSGVKYFKEYTGANIMNEPLNTIWYSSDYTVDESTGLFTLGTENSPVYTGNFEDIPSSELVGKYFIMGNSSSNAASIGLFSSIESEINTLYPKFYYINTEFLVQESTEQVLSETPDMYTQTTGINSYYYRGGVEDNYLEFNNMCFRIVRIEGDGSIKLTLAKENKCSTITDDDYKSALINNANRVNYGAVDYYDSANDIYIEYDIADYHQGGLKESLETWFDLNLKNHTNLLKEDTWCLGGTADLKYNPSTGILMTEAEVEEAKKNTSSQIKWYYTAGKRLLYDKTAGLKCDNEDTFSSYVGTLTADEVTFAGKTMSDYNQRVHYLYDNAIHEYGYWTLSNILYEITHKVPVLWGYVMTEDEYTTGMYFGSYFATAFPASADPGVRPAITLKNEISYASGDGTKTNPYKIKY